MFQILEFTEALLATVTAERLREVLSYDAVTGVFRWRVTLSRRAVAGKVAGCKHKTDGRIYIGIDGRIYLAHRLAWLYERGEWPPNGIDHRDTCNSHNAFANLRPATQAENMQNLRRAHRDNKTGFLGVVRRSDGLFIGSVARAGVRVLSKPFPTASQAHSAYLEIKALFHPFATIS